MVRTAPASRLAALLLLAAPGLAGQGFGNQNRVDSTTYVRTTPPTDPVIQAMWTEGMEHGQAMSLAQVLMDSIGPRLTNSDRFDAGQGWLVKKYAEWGINAERQQYGTWVKWIRGATHLDMVQPRLKTMEAYALAWSPPTPNNGSWVEAEAILRPTTPAEWASWPQRARGKFVLASSPQPTCRFPAQMQEFAEQATLDRMTAERNAWRLVDSTALAQGGDPRKWAVDAGVAGMLTNRWSNFPGIDKIFGSPKDKVPTIDVSCEDYSLLYRLAANGMHPVVRLSVQSQDLGEQPVHNVIATIPGTEKPNEYIVLSAHYDSWDGGTGATDNGTGTITMFEAARILKKVYPNPKRTIIIGHWGGEEQGLNGSKAFAEDHPEIVAHVHAGFNQDNGTGRVVSAGPGPFPAGLPALQRYLMAIPSSMTGRIRLGGISGPATGGTDNASFQCLKSPVYGLGALGWDYGNTTWHTNRDTYDKVIAEDLQNNATLVAMLVYMADQDPTLLSHEVAMPRDRSGNETAWPTCAKSDRNTASSPR